MDKKYLCATMPNIHTAILHTGSNIGDRASNLRIAAAQVAEKAGPILRASAVYSTQPWGIAGQPDFLNQALCISTELEPKALLETILEIEKSMGRERREKWGQRIIDIDIIFYDDRIVHEEGLHIPHPQMHLRNFVLAPLSEIAPGWIHPELGKAVIELWGQSPDELAAAPWNENDGAPGRADWEPGAKLPYPFIVVEGNIGAGKTTLCQMLARDFGCRLILEQFAENPFLPYFYHNPERYAFPVELFFMTERHKQLQEELQQQSLFEETIVADYFFLKTLLFAKNNLSEEEYRLFQRLFSVLNAAFPKPDLLVYLHRPVDALLQNIRKRGRAYEQEISGDYLQQIQQVYFDFFKSDPPFPILILEVEQADFQAEPAHYREIVKMMFREFNGGILRESIGARMGAA